MSASVALGLLLALCCAVIALLGFLFKQRGAVGAPPVQWRRPVHSTVALFQNRWWTLGIITAMAGWVFHVVALGLAPISLVQSVIAGGLVLLTPIADRLFGLHVTRRDWIGVAITAAGLAMLAATLSGTADDAHDDYEVGTLLVYIGVLIAASFLACFAVRGDTGRTGPILGIAAGLLWGASDVTIKAGVGHFDEDGLLILFTWQALTITVVSLIGLVVSARSLQLGPAVAVIAITSAAANLVTIAAGPIVFDEPLPSEPGALAVRILAFVAVIGGAALTPGPREEELDAIAGVAGEPARTDVPVSGVSSR